MQANGTFSVSRWEEKSLNGDSAQNLISQVSATFDASGDINGRLDVEYLMHNIRKNADDPHDADAKYTGYLVFTGAIAQQSGSFVLADQGTYSKKGPASALAIQPNSGTGGFVGITGDGGYSARGEQMVIELTYTL